MKSLSLKIDGGSVIALVGHSGSGKTTIIDLILGLLFPDGGKIYLNNKFLNLFRQSLFFKLGLMVSFFASGLLIFLAFITNQSYTEQDSILDAHEFYYYSQMVESWGNPPDSTKILTDVKNLLI